MEFIDVETALDSIAEKTNSLATEVVSIDESMMRILAQDIVSTIAVPPFDNSAMDGVAVRFADVEDQPLELVGTIAAGDAPNAIAVPKGSAVKIMTGAPVPTDCDCVVMREWVVEEEGKIRLTEKPNLGDHIRQRGDYVDEGEVVRKAGDLIDPGTISLLATFGISSVNVSKKPRVTILTTGDELVPIDQPLGPGKIRNSNAWMLKALFRTLGIDATVPPIVKDDRESVETAFRDAIEGSDLVVSVGGVSVGDFDFVRETIETICDDVSFWRIKMKPGKPLTHGVAKGTQLLGLPGNPMSAFVSFHLFASPLIHALQGRSDAWDSTPTSSKAGESLRSTPKRREYVVGKLDGDVFNRIGDQSSGNLAAMAGCNALAILDEGIDLINEGDPLSVIRISTTA